MFPTDTIAALATPPGTAALGVVRISGPQALAIADAVWRGKRLSEQASHTLHWGYVVEARGEKGEARGDADQQFTLQQSPLIDEAVASVFRAPRSYTGEDSVEFSCHGSPYVLGRVLEACIRAGARPAGPGEFTQRAFLAGKLDLAQAEAVADLIASSSEAAHRAALHSLRGGFSSELKSLREELIHFAALVELELDFSDEDVEFADRAQLHELLQRIGATTSALIQSFRLGNAVKEGIAVAIVGRPNAGKSTLLNALLGEERAIVSEIPGTTRDSIEEALTIGGVRFRIIDTAGIRDETADTIERIGIERSYAAAEGAALVLHLLDLSAENPEDPALTAWLRERGKNVIRVLNKTDLLPSSRRGLEADVHGGVFIAAKTSDGISALKDAMYSAAVGGLLLTEGTLVTNARHHAALLQVQEEIEAVQAGLDSGLPGDLLAHHIRQALYGIGTITGAVLHDRDVLGAIFGKFCIGK